MTKLTIAGPTAQAFADIQEEVLVYNEQGQPLGFFRPAISSDPNDYQRARSQMSIEELKRRAAGPATGITTAELMAKLDAIPLPETK